MEVEIPPKRRPNIRIQKLELSLVKLKTVKNLIKATKLSGWREC